MTSISLEPLWAAFVAASAELSEPSKAGSAQVETRTGRNYSYSYLTLPQLNDAVRVVFARHGLAFRQQVSTEEQLVTVVTTIVHQTGGCWSTGPLTLHAASHAPQDLGSTMTYARRYQLAALVGLAGADDNDAADQQSTAPTSATKKMPFQSASRAGTGTSSSPPTPGGAAKPTDKQVRYLHQLLGRHGYNSRESLLAWISGELGRTVESSSDLAAVEVSQLIDTLKATPGADRATAADDGIPPEDPWAARQ